jgi:hypothetical protein
MAEQLIITSKEDLIAKIRQYLSKDSGLPDINTWDVTDVDDMSFVFSYFPDFNEDISGWDVSGVDCINFNQDLTPWDVKEVEFMSMMFNSCSAFNKPLNWGTKKSHIVIPLTK